MKIENPRFEFDDQGYAFIGVTVDGRPARIYEGQMYWQEGFLFLGAAFEDRVPVLTAPPNPALGRQRAQELHGFTDDPRLTRLYEQFFNELRSTQFNFTPRPVVLPEVPA
jgi:hypothetical protein